jgi:hypothetical protein
MKYEYKVIFLYDEDELERELNYWSSQGGYRVAAMIQGEDKYIAFLEREAR